MPVTCPECEGQMRYDPTIRQYCCTSCGLSLTHAELFEEREKVRSREGEEERRKREHREYLKWWLSKK